MKFSQKEAIEAFKNISFTRLHLYGGLAACLVGPLFVLAAYGTYLGIPLFDLALLLSLVGGCGGGYVLFLWEKRLQKTVAKLVRAKINGLQLPEKQAAIELEELKKEKEALIQKYEHQIDLLQSSVAKSKEQVRNLYLEMDRKFEEMRAAYLEFEDLRKEYAHLREEYETYQNQMKEQLKHKELLLGEYQKTITEQRHILEKKQRYIGNLEGKVRDLMYEIRSLLQLEESASNLGAVQVDFTEQSLSDYYLPPVKAAAEPAPFDLSLLLQKYVEQAETLTGVEHFGRQGGKGSRFMDLSSDNFIDRRRLFDLLKDETHVILFVYSKIEEKFLFVTPNVKNITGWVPEKFIKDPMKCMAKGSVDFQRGLRTTQEIQLDLSLIRREGKNLECDCLMALINQGPFAQHLIGILSPKL